MRTSSTFSILFWIYSQRAINNQTNIYARITVNGKRVNISLKQKVDVDAWNAKSQKMKGNGSTAVLNSRLCESLMWKEAEPL